MVGHPNHVRTSGHNWFNSCRKNLEFFFQVDVTACATNQLILYVAEYPLNLIFETFADYRPQTPRKRFYRLTDVHSCSYSAWKYANKFSKNILDK